MTPLVPALASHNANDVTNGTTAFLWLRQSNWYATLFFLVMWYHWHWHHMIPVALSMAHGTYANTGTRTSTKGHIIPLNNPLNITNAMVWMMAPSASHYCHINDNYYAPQMPHIKQIMPINSCLHIILLSVYIPPMNPLQSTMWTGNFKLY